MLQATDVYSIVPKKKGLELPENQSSTALSSEVCIIMKQDRN